MVDDNLKLVAFNLARNVGGQELFKITVDAFDLVASNGLFQRNVEGFVAQRRYHEVRMPITCPPLALTLSFFQACQMADELCLVAPFTIYHFVLPLILQNKSTFAEKYLAKAVEMQQPLIDFLDSLLDENEDAAREILVDCFR